MDSWLTKMMLCIASRVALSDPTLTMVNAKNAMTHAQLAPQTCASSVLMATSLITEPVLPLARTINTLPKTLASVTTLIFIIECDPACNGCTGSTSNECKACQPYFRTVSVQDTVTVCSSDCVNNDEYVTQSGTCEGKDSY